MPDNKHIAIVIPAYKAKFLEKALNSILAQTDKRFRLYIGDDCSPENIQQICNRFSSRIDMIYKHFEENLGQEHLVQHWNRCIRLTSEPWIWLFSDDDIMDKQCVESFYKTLQSTGNKYHVYRFNTHVIDANDKIIRINPPHPSVESCIKYAYHRLKMDRESYAAEYIFSRKAFNREGGMIDFPMAWCSDDASWISFAGKKGIFTVHGPNVKWRYSRINISASNTLYRNQKIKAAYQYIRWWKGRFFNATITDLNLDHQALNQCAKNWFYHQLRLVSPLGISNYSPIAACSNHILNAGWIETWLRLFAIDLMFYRNKILNLLLK